MIAGGTGYAPMKAMLLEAMTRTVGNPVHLFWGGRDAQDLYEQEQLMRWQKQLPWFTFTPVTESGDGESTIDTGRVDDVARATYAELNNAMIYVSGPPGLVQSVVDTCQQLGIDDQRLITDSFDYAS
ncbi:MAG: hypothetical protein AAGF72_19255 [Pseudomonadota bacterium]